MNSLDSTNYDTFLPEYETIPDDWDEAKVFIAEQMKKIAQAVNVREIGWFLDSETISGKQFIPGPSNANQFRTIFRKVFNTGNLPNVGAPKLIPHGITVDQNFTLIHLYGSANQYTPNLFFIPLPYSDIGGQIISLSMNETNIVISVNVNEGTFTSSFVIIEYSQEM